MTEHTVAYAVAHGWGHPDEVWSYGDESIHAYRAGCGGLCCADVRAARGQLRRPTLLDRLAQGALPHVPGEFNAYRYTYRPRSRRR